MVLGPLHTLADLGDVGKDGLLVAFTHALGRWDLVALGAASGMVRVLLGQEAEESALQKGQCRVGLMLELERGLPRGDRIVWVSGRHGSRCQFRVSYTRSVVSIPPGRLQRQVSSAACQVIQLSTANAVRRGGITYMSPS